jgi:hypothetical protein
MVEAVVIGQSMFVIAVTPNSDQRANRSTLSPKEAPQEEDVFVIATGARSNLL